MDSDSTRRKDWPRALWRKAVWLCLISGAMGLGVFVWHSCQKADIAARKTNLALLRTLLVGYAEKSGHYPPDLDGVLEAEERFRARLELDNLIYIAAELPYYPGGKRELLYEQAARRYGFEKGWFRVYEDWVRFVPGERPGSGG